MPSGTPYYSFALPYPIRVDNFTDILDDLPPPYNRPPLYLLTHTHSDHIHGLASKSFAYRIICSPDTKEMLLRHEVYAERSLHDHQYRAEKKKLLGHLKIGPLWMPNGQKFFTGSRDLLHAIPLNTPTKFELTNNETVTITLIDANHCPGSVMFLIEGPRGAVLHTGDFRAEPWFLSSIQRNHFLQPYLANPSGDLRIYVARREGTLAEATGLVKTLEAIYLDTACFLSDIVVPSKERAVRGIVELIALFPSSTYFFINTWTWGYEDILKAIAHAFHCKIHFDRYKHSIYSHGSDPFLRALGTRDASATRFHACERFDRCPFVDIPPCNSGAQGAVAPPSREGKKVVYVNAVNMSSAHWENYHANIRLRVSRGENVDSLLVPLSRHSPLPELMSFVALFRPLRVVPNTLDPSLNGVDWGVMCKIFSKCLSPTSTSGHLASVMAPPCALTSGPSVAKLPGPSIKYDPAELSRKGGEEQVDTAYLNLVGPSDAADEWSDKGRRRARLDVLKAWLSAKRPNGSGRAHKGIDENDAALAEMDTDVHGPMDGAPGPASRGPTTGSLEEHERCGDSDESSNEGGSDDHARTAWKIFGFGEPEDGCKTWLSPSPQPQDPLPTPTSSPFLHERGLADTGQKYVPEQPMQGGLQAMTSIKYSLERVPTEIVPPPVIPEVSPIPSPCTSPFVSFDDDRISARSPEEQVVGSNPFTCLKNFVPSEPRDIGLPLDVTQQRGQSQQTARRTLSTTQTSGNTDRKTNGNFREGPRPKRRKVDPEESEAEIREKGSVPEPSEGEQLHICAQDETCGSPPASSHASIVPPLAREGSKAASPQQILCGPDPEISGTRSASVSTTISFPVRKHVNNRTNRTRKTTSFGWPTAHAKAAEASTHTNKAPLSPRTAARRDERAMRKQTTEKLRLARPDLATQPKLSRRGSRHIEQGALSTFSAEFISATAKNSALPPVSGKDLDASMDEMGEDMKVNWENSRRLAEKVREAVRRGDRASEVLPRLPCLEGWYAERG